MKWNQILKTTCAVLALACLVTITQLWSQEMAPPPGGMGGHMGHQMPSAQERTDRLAGALNLSSDQKAKVLSAYQDEDKQMSALRSDTGTSRDDKWSKMKQIHENTASQIKSSLNPDQAKQFDAMEQKMMEGHHHGGGMGQQPQQ